MVAATTKTAAAAMATVTASDDGDGNGRGSGGFPPPFFYFSGKLKIPKSEKREEKETDHGLTTPPFPSALFFQRS